MSFYVKTTFFQHIYMTFISGNRLVFSEEAQYAGLLILVLCQFVDQSSSR